MVHTIVCSVPFVYGAGNLFSGSPANVAVCLVLIGFALAANSVKVRNYLYGVTA